MENKIFKAVNILVTKFIPYRNLENVSPPSKGDMINRIRNLGYIEITTRRKKPRGKRDFLAFVITKADNTESIKVIYEKYAKKNNLDELMLIVDEKFFDNRHAINKIKEYKLNESKIYDPDGNKPYLTVRLINNFLFDIPNHHSVPEHTIVDDNEFERLAEWEHIEDKRNLQRIYEDDPPVVWLGGKVGQVVKIIRDSSTCGKSIAYRCIVRRKFMTTVKQQTLASQEFNKVEDIQYEEEVVEEGEESDEEIDEEEGDEESVIGDDEESVIGDDEESIIGDDEESVIGDDEEEEL